MPETLAMGWRQYRLERRMFWRNPTAAFIATAGRLFFGIPWPRDALELLVFVAVGVVCFASLGVALSHAIPNFESAPAYVNAVFLPTIFISGVFYDVKHTPAFLRNIA